MKGKNKGKNDLTNIRFGKLVAIEPTDQRKAGYVMWRCRCDCGNEILAESRHIKRGTLLDCGCVPKVKAGRDLTGQRFGQLIALYETEKRDRDGRVVWHCRCDCGNETEAPSGQLLAGYRKSCGCLSHPPLKNWIGKKFGELTIISYAGKRKGMHFWNCRCSCGKEAVISQSNLQSGHSKSCGCLNVPLRSRHFIKGTCIESIRSRTIFANNTSGIRGVYLNKKSGKWTAQITFQGKTCYLGSYASKEDAAKARARGEERFDKFLDWYEEKFTKIRSAKKVEAQT